MNTRIKFAIALMGLFAVATPALATENVELAGHGHHRLHAFFGHHHHHGFFRDRGYTYVPTYVAPAPVPVPVQAVPAPQNCEYFHDQWRATGDPVWKSKYIACIS